MRSGWFKVRAMLMALFSRSGATTQTRYFFSKFRFQGDDPLGVETIVIGQ